MIIALYAKDALSAFRSGHSDKALSKPRVQLPDGFVPHLSWTEALFLRDRFDTEIPVNCCVMHSKYRRCVKTLRCKVLSRHLPAESFLHLGKKTYVCSPELCIFGIKDEYDVIECALIISELCSGYRTSNDGQSSYTEAAPVSSLSSMKEFVSKSAKAKGVKKMEKAVALAVEDADSPIETALALLLSMPSDMGGFGLKKPKMNRPLRNAEEHLSFVRTREPIKEELYGDLVFPEKRLVVEYLSKKHHEKSWDADAIRYNKLLELGYSTVSVTPAQLFGINGIREVARTIAKQLDASLPEETEEWLNANTALHERLTSPFASR